MFIVDRSVFYLIHPWVIEMTVFFYILHLLRNAWCDEIGLYTQPPIKLLIYSTFYVIFIFIFFFSGGGMTETLYCLLVQFISEIERLFGQTTFSLASRLNRFHWKTKSQRVTIAISVTLKECFPVVLLSLILWLPNI